MSAEEPQKPTEGGGVAEDAIFYWEKLMMFFYFNIDWVVLLVCGYLL